MKPPSRPRITPSRFLEIKKTEPVRRIRTSCHRLEHRRLLLALRQQKKFKSEVDFLALQKKVPKWSLLQIQSLIRYLRRCVVHRVHVQVQKQSREEQKTKVPIEIWAKLTQKMAGVHEETISSAFSQMLVIAATEPCSLRNSVPPRTTDCPSPLESGLRNIPQRSMPKSHPGSPSPVMIPGLADKTPQSHGKDAASNSSAPLTTVISPSAIAEEELNELQQKSEADKDPVMPSRSATHKSLLSQPVSKPTPPLSASSATSTAAPSPDKQPESAESEQNCQYKPRMMKTVVNFEKIYQFMSNIILKNQVQPLTPMESAVLLDLLMSLPEELPLLDCKELQHHLLQVHARLNTPTVRLSTDQGPTLAHSATSSVGEQQTSRADQHAKGPDVLLHTQNVQCTGEGSVHKGAVTEQVKAAEAFAGPSPAIKQSEGNGDWATAGFCPLNPFSVPVALLKRK